jgi:hypothetical protein
VIWIAVAIVAAIGAIEVAKIKYAVAREAVSALDRIIELEKNLEGVDWEQVKILSEEVQALHNMNQLGGRR